MLSQTVEYALRATIFIARDHPRPLRVPEIAEAIGAPRNYLSKILGALARVGILESTRGPTGGFRLKARAEDISLRDVVHVFESTEKRRCLLGHGICGQNPSCTAHVRWLPVAQSMDRFFESTTVADLLSDTTLTRGAPFNVPI